MVYIIILNYNGWQDTVECLNSFKSSLYTDFKIIVVDNNSSDNSVQFINEWVVQNGASFGVIGFEKNEKNEYTEYNYDSKITILQSSTNDGYASGNNIGIRYALANGVFNYIWILNNDTIIQTDTLIKLVNFSEKVHVKKTGLIGTTIRYYYHPNVIQNLGCSYNPIWGFPSQRYLDKKVDRLDISNLNIEDIDYISGCSVFVSRDFINEVGLMNQEYFLYFEEIDWAIRGKRKGFNLDFCYESIVYHKDGSSTKKDKKSKLYSPFSDYHFTRSKLIFSRKHFKKYMITVYLSFIVVIMNRIRRGQFASIPTICRAIFQDLLYKQ